MTFDEYQKHSFDTAVYPAKGHNVVYPALGLAGETGEVCEKIKKALRDEGGSDQRGPTGRVGFGTGRRALACECPGLGIGPQSG